MVESLGLKPEEVQIPALLSSAVSSLVSYPSSWGVRFLICKMGWREDPIPYSAPLLHLEDRAKSWANVG